MVTVMLLAFLKVVKLVGASRLEKLPVLTAGVGALAVRTIEFPPLVTVAVGVPVIAVAVKVPVPLASAPLAVNVCAPTVTVRTAKARPSRRLMATSWKRMSASARVPSATTRSRR